MPQTPTPLIRRPQTLKQAKKAYRKSTGIVRLSESEKAMLERRAVLQERADRINEREARRKANLKKREEKVQREREVRQRMGIPTPPGKEGIHVGPSQLHLSGFVFGGVKRKRDEEEEEGGESGAQTEKELVIPEQHEYSMEPARSQQLPRMNASPKLVMPSHTVDTKPSEVLEFTLQRNWTPHERTPPARSPLQARTANPTIQQKQLARNTKNRDIQVNSSQLQRPQVPPPDQAPTKTPPIFRQPPSLQPPFKADSIPEDYLDSFFVSNTQIQRELSPPPTPPTRTASPNNATSISLTPPQPPTPPNLPATSNTHPIATDNPADLLAFISTQDLDFTDELTQLSPLAPLGPPLQKPNAEQEQQSGSESESEEFPDSELESIVLAFTLESPTPDPQSPIPPLQTQTSSRSHHTTTTTNAPTRTTTHNSSQTQCRHEQRESQRQEPQRVVAAEYDAFEFLCTQDLMELES
ncbi:hypothetical protein BDR22DRAFT_835654 [Usnea florida]